MKRFLSAVLCFALLLSAAGCSKEQKEPQRPESPATQVQPEGGKTEEPEIPEIPESTPEDEELRRLTVLIGSEGEAEWGDGVPMCSASWQTLALDEQSAQRYPKLAESLEQLNRESEVWGKEFVTDNLEFAVEMYNDRGEYFYGLTDSDAYTVQRADEVILSIRGDQSSYTGGAHPNYGAYGINLVPETGERVQLTDVLTGTEGLAELLVEKILEKYPDEPFPSLPETLAAYEPENYSWTLGYQGLTFYFSPYEIAPYAAGLLTVTIWFDEAPELFREEYLRTPEYGYGMALPVSSPVEFDLDSADGVRDEIMIGSMLVDESEICRPVIRVNGVELSAEDIYFYEMWPYLVHVEGKTYIYLESMSENDYRTLSVYDLNGEEVVQRQTVYGKGFHGVWYEEEGEYGVFRNEVFTNPESFMLDTRLDVLGTMNGTNVYRVNAADGLLLPEHDFYALDEGRAPLTALIPVEVEILPGGSRETVQPGTQLRFLRTDGESYVDMRLPDGRECRIRAEVGSEGWGWYINGVPEWDCFEGLFYAG